MVISAGYETAGKRKRRHAEISQNAREESQIRRSTIASKIGMSSFGLVPCARHKFPPRLPIRPPAYPETKEPNPTIKVIINSRVRPCQELTKKWGLGKDGLGALRPFQILLLLVGRPHGDMVIQEAEPDPATFIRFVGTYCCVPVQALFPPHRGGLARLPEVMKGEIQDLLLPGSEKIIRVVNLVSSRENISRNRFGFSENREMNYKGKGLRILQTFAK